MAKSLLSQDSTDLGSQPVVVLDDPEVQLGHLSSGGNSTKSVVCVCQKCGQHYTIKYCKIKQRSSPCCNKCIRQLAAVKISASIHHQLDHGQLRETVSAGLRKKWRDDPDFRERATKANKLNGSIKTSNKSHPEAIRALWQNEKYRQSQTAAKSDPSYRAKISKAIIAKWTDDQYRLRISESSRLLWERDGYRGKIAKALAQQPKISSIQRTLYGILDDLGLAYTPELVLGPWTFDCCMQRDNGKDILIECQGDYWHSLPQAKSRDRAKATYISKYFGEQYELKYLWEHEFLCQNKIIELVKYWSGLSEFELEQFVFGDINVSPCKADQYRLLLEKYHYLMNAGRGGLAIGAWLTDNLIGVVVFSPVIRQNIKLVGHDNSSVRELSRLCIHPRYQKPNFGSWFISRAIKKLPDQVRCILAYSDTTFNHTGGVYRASNFEFDRVVNPEYWYISLDGWVMHKKTLYNHAKRMRLKEAEYAEINGYTKVRGNEKLRYKYER